MAESCGNIACDLHQGHYGPCMKDAEVKARADAKRNHGVHMGGSHGRSECIHGFLYAQCRCFDHANRKPTIVSCALITNHEQKLAEKEQAFTLSTGPAAEAEAPFDPDDANFTPLSEQVAELEEQVEYLKVLQREAMDDAETWRNEFYAVAPFMDTWRHTREELTAERKKVTKYKAALELILDADHGVARIAMQALGKFG